VASMRRWRNPLWRSIRGYGGGVGGKGATDTTPGLSLVSQWNIDELNNEIEEICGTFSSFDQSDSAFPQSPSVVGSQEITSPAVHRRDNDRIELPSVQIDDRDERRTQTIAPENLQNKQIILLTRTSLPSTIPKNINHKVFTWDGTVPSLLSAVSSQSQNGSEGLIVIEEEPLDESCRQILQLVQRSSPVMILRLNGSSASIPTRNEELRTLSGFDLTDGISMAIFGLSNSVSARRPRPN
jgi:hypothetical protein